ncbi:RHS repeat protein [Diaphorobacter sp. HDW4A]|uniref:RHS repeat-associated core domain-containing protein n=1 Tax=Diaphorobacter sp. HDW4A TaxID=2714924 RepID=UPI00140E292E|nr:RHS repeat-associated core domain-containing protein [Diaphorobacter sp. HDW4A]QIL80982.1 RHS repeat protein [Diaphorobacter sp. HDW4A]
MQNRRIKVLNFLIGLILSITSLTSQAFFLGEKTHWWLQYSADIYSEIHASPEGACADIFGKLVAAGRLATYPPYGPYRHQVGTNGPDNYICYFLSTKDEGIPTSNWLGIGPAYTCPENTKERLTTGNCECQDGFKEIRNQCIIPRASNMCEMGSLFGNPISPSFGEKLRFESDIFDSSPHGLTFDRYYRSYSGGSPEGGAKHLGKGWSHNHHMKLIKYFKKTYPKVAISNQQGELVEFTPTNNGKWEPTNVNVADTLIHSVDTWTFRPQKSDTSYVFTEDGILRKKIERNNWITEYDYESTDPSKIATIKNNFGKQLTFSYIGDRISSIEDQAGKFTQYTYSLDSKKNLLSVIYPDGSEKIYIYNDLDLLIGIIDETGVEWGKFAYDSNKRAIKTELPNGIESYSITYSQNGFTSVKDPLGTVRQFAYNTTMDGRIQSTSASLPSADGSNSIKRQTTNYYGILSNQEDFLGRSTALSWNDRSLLTQIYEDNIRSTTIEWHHEFNIPTKIKTGSIENAFTYDISGRLLSHSFGGPAPAPQSTSRWEYNADGLVERYYDPAQYITKYTYDSAGNNTSTSNPLGQVTSSTYDAYGAITSTTTPSNILTAIQYTPRGKITKANVGGLVSDFLYSPTNLLHTSTFYNGHKIQYQYDDAHRLVGWSDNRGYTAQYTLDAMGNRINESIKDANQIEYWKLTKSINNLNRVSSITIGDIYNDIPSQTITQTYDLNGDLQQVKAGGTQTTFVRDGIRRIKSLTNSSNAVATITRNEGDHVTKATDFKGIATNYSRDIFGNATQELTPDAGTTNSLFDIRGLATSTTDATGRTIGIEHDALGRTTKLSYNDNTTSLLKYDLTGTTYNTTDAPNASIGSLSEVQDPGVTTQYQRDALSRIVRKTQTLTGGETRSTSYTYVPAGQGGAGSLQSITYPSGKTLTYSYDSTGLITGLTWNGAPLVSALQWSPLGVPTVWTWPGIKMSPTDPSSLFENRQYNTAGQLIHSGLLDLTWDAAGRVTAIAQSHMIPGSGSDPAQRGMVSSSFNYNATGNLTASAHALMVTPAVTLPAGVTLPDVVGYTSLGYSYDANGNRTSGAFAKNIGGNSPTMISRTYVSTAGTNRLASVTSTSSAGGTIPAKTYEYDASGSLTSAAGQYLHYGPNGRVAKLTGTTSSIDPLAVSYVYNSSSQRVLKTDARTAGASVSEHAFYSDDDGTSPLGFYSSQRSSNSAAPAGENDSTELLYLPTANGLIPIAAQINGRIYAIDTDHLNTPRRLTNADGQVAWQWLITGFGEVTPTTGATGYLQPGSTATAPSYAPAVTFNLRYPGQQWDQETGLAYNINRYYDASSGRYIQADPIGLDGGWNRFAYVGSNPLNSVDPMGLATREQIDTAIQLLQGSFPEILRRPNSVTGVPSLSGTLGQLLAGRTDLSGNIKYNADLYGPDGVSVPDCKIDDFLQTMAHEMQHLNESWYDRIGLSTGELLHRISPKYPSIEDIIDHNADLMYGSTINKFKRSTNGKR